MLVLTLPEPTNYPASVFDQNGDWVMSGHREECETKAQELGFLYCLNINGSPIIKQDFEY